MIDKEECEAIGKVWVDGYKRDDGVYVKPYCRDKDMSKVAITDLKMAHENFAMARSEFDETHLGEFLDKNKPMDKNMEIEEGEASRNVKLPRSNTANARRVMGSIKMDSGRLNSDIRHQDFRDAQFQSMTLEHDAQAEANEDSRLAASQMVKSEELYAGQKEKIGKREYRENRSKNKHEARASKKSIKQEKERIRHERKEEKRQKKLERLSQKSGKSGE